MSAKEKRKNDGGEEIRPSELTNYEQVLIFAGLWAFLVFTLPCSCVLCLIVFDRFRIRGQWFYSVTSMVVAVLLDIAIVYVIVRFGKNLDKLRSKRGKQKR